MQPAQMSRCGFNCEACADKSKIMAFAGSKHHAMFTQTDRLGVMVNGGMVNGKKRHCEQIFCFISLGFYCTPAPAAINQQTRHVGRRSQPPPVSEICAILPTAITIDSEGRPSGQATQRFYQRHLSARSFTIPGCEQIRYLWHRPSIFPDPSTFSSPPILRWFVNEPI